MAALTGALFAGISNFAFKVAAKRNYDSSIFALYGGMAAILLMVGALLVYPSPVLSAMR